MRQDCRTVFTFDELSDSAKERARDWYLQGFEFEFDHVIEDAVRAASALGITIATRAVPLHGGGTRQKPIVYFDLGRGSGVAFSATYAYKTGSVKAIKAEYPRDTELIGIAETLRKVQQTAFYRLYAAVHDCNRGTSIRADVDRDDYTDVTTAQAETVAQALQDFASWVLSALQAEYEYQTSDDCVAENIIANEYEFTEDGRRI